MKNEKNNWYAIKLFLSIPLDRRDLFVLITVKKKLILPFVGSVAPPVAVFRKILLEKAS